MFLSNKRITELSGAFKLLLSRALPPISAQRGAILYNSLRPTAEAYEEQVKVLAQREAVAVKIEDDAEKDRVMADIRAEFETLQAAEFEIADPKMKLGQHDLPKPDKKAESPSANTAGNGIIQAILSPEFFDLVDPDTKADAEDE